MDKDLDILAQKFLAGDLNPEEAKRVEELSANQDWNDVLDHYRSIQADLKKMSFLDQQRAHLKKVTLKEKQKSGGSYKWLLFTGLAAAVLVLIYVSLPKEEDKDELASDNRVTQKAEDDMAKEVSSDDAKTDVEEAVGDNYDFKDEDIISNSSVYNFKPKNVAYDSLMTKVDSANTGVMTLISQEGSQDSTYVFAQEFNNTEIEKSVSYVGSTGLYAIFNLVSKDQRTGEVQRSIMLFDRQMNYKARYVVKSVDELAKGVTSRGFVVDIFHDDGTVTKVSYDLTKDLECLDFPLWYTVCPAYF